MMMCHPSENAICERAATKSPGPATSANTSEVMNEHFPVRSHQRSGA